MERRDFSISLSADARKDLANGAVAIEIIGQSVSAQEIRDSAVATMDRKVKTVDFCIRPTLVLNERHGAEAVKFPPHMDFLYMRLSIRQFRYVTEDWDRVIFSAIIAQDVTPRAEQLSQSGVMGENHDLSSLQLGAKVECYFDSTVGWGAIYSVNGINLALPTRFPVPDIDTPEVSLPDGDEFFNPQQITLGKLAEDDSSVIKAVEIVEQNWSKFEGKPAEDKPAEDSPEPVLKVEPEQQHVDTLLGTNATKGAAANATGIDVLRSTVGVEEGGGLF